jgi:hypothetical protein
MGDGSDLRVLQTPAGRLCDRHEGSALRRRGEPPDVANIRAKPSVARSEVLRRIGSQPPTERHSRVAVMTVDVGVAGVGLPSH